MHLSHIKFDQLVAQAEKVNMLKFTNLSVKFEFDILHAKN